MKLLLIGLMTITSLGIATNAASAEDAPTDNSRYICKENCEVPFTGTVKASCDCEVSRPGILAGVGSLPTKLSTTNSGGQNGVFKAICNSRSAKVAYTFEKITQTGATQLLVGKYTIGSSSYPVTHLSGNSLAAAPFYAASDPLAFKNVVINAEAGLAPTSPDAVLAASVIDMKAIATFTP